MERNPLEDEATTTTQDVGGGGVDAIVATPDIDTDVTTTGSSDPWSTPGTLDTNSQTRSGSGASPMTGSAPYASASGTGSPAGGLDATSGSGTGDRLQQAASSVATRAADTAQSRVGGQLNGQLDRAAGILEQVAQAVRQTGDQMREQQPEVAGLADTAAEQVDRASQFLHQNDVNGIVQEAESVGRRQPLLFLGAALAIGVVAGRFLKASPHASGSNYGRGANRYDGS